MKKPLLIILLAVLGLGALLYFAEPLLEKIDKG